MYLDYIRVFTVANPLVKINGGDSYDCNGRGVKKLLERYGEIEISAPILHIRHNEAQRILPGSYFSIPGLIKMFRSKSTNVISLYYIDVPVQSGHGICSSTVGLMCQTYQVPDVRQM